MSVPVLSKTAEFTEASASSAPPLRTMIERLAARLMPPMIATGAARMSGQGVATTSTANTRFQSCDTNHAITQAAMVSGVNHTAHLSAVRCSGLFEACALRTRSTMRAY